MLGAGLSAQNSTFKHSAVDVLVRMLLKTTPAPGNYPLPQFDQKWWRW